MSMYVRKRRETPSTSEDGSAHEGLCLGHFHVFHARRRPSCVFFLAFPYFKSLFNSQNGRRELERAAGAARVELEAEGPFVNLSSFLASLSTPFNLCFCLFQLKLFRFLFDLMLFELIAAFFLLTFAFDPSSRASLILRPWS